MLSRRAFLHLVSSAAAGAALPACADAPVRSPRPVQRPAVTPASLPAPRSVEAIIARANLGGQVGFTAIDLDTGQTIETLNGDALLPPASVAKAVTAVYALEALGADHRFATRVLTTGTVRDGTLAGDLILMGGGDPTLDTDALAGLVDTLHARGLRRVDGRFLVHGGALPRIDQIADDQPVQAGYNSTVSGLNLNFNRVHFQWNRSGSDYTVVMDARSAAHQPRVSMAEMRVINRQVPVYTFSSENGRDRWTVARAALGGGGARWLPVRQPELYAAEVFRTLAAGRGITLPQGQVVTGGVSAGTALAEHRSDPLHDLVRSMLRFSTNITAEALGLAATQARGGSVRSLSASAGVMNRWATQRFDMGRPGFVDHSGLGAQATVPMTDLARFFAITAQQGPLPDLLRRHDMLDTNRNVIPNHPLDVRAKTGTLNFASALGGVVQTPGARRYAFAIAAADLPRRARLTGDDRERPEGGIAWTRRARRMQQELIERWGALGA